MFKIRIIINGFILSSSKNAFLQKTHLKSKHQNKFLILFSSVRAFTIQSLTKKSLKSFDKTIFSQICFDIYVKRKLRKL